MENHASIPSQDLILSIKKEPKEEDSCINCTEEPLLKSLVLRFVRDKGGMYSVVPLIKPDPFFEEHFEDLCYGDSYSSVKIKEEYIDGSTAWGTNSVVIKKECIKENNSDDTYKTKTIGDGTSPRNTNDKIKVERHVRKEYIEGATAWGTNSVAIKKECVKENSDEDTCKAKTIGDGTSPGDTNDKIKIERHTGREYIEGATAWGTNSVAIKKDCVKENITIVDGTSPGDTNDKIKVERHTRRVHSQPPFHCRFCGRNNFRDLVSLETHLLSNHRHIKDAVTLIKGQIFSCNLCNFQSLKRSNYRRHLTTHDDKNLKKCLDSETYATDIKMALKKTRYNCYHCSYATKDKGSIVKHVRLHKSSKFKPFTCTVCKRNFNEKNSLDSHIVKRHFGDKKLRQIITNRIYECELCHFKDVNKSKLVRHKTSHVKKERKRRKTNKTVNL